MSESEQAQPRGRRVLGCGCFVWALAGIGLLLVLAQLLLFISARLPRPPPPPQVRCLSNLKQIAVATLMYAQDYDDRLPPLSRWNERVYPIVGNEQVFKCPADDSRRDLSYGMNQLVSGLDLDAAPDQPETVMLFDGVGQTVVERHNEGANYAFVDGHVKWYSEPPAGLQPMQVIDR